MNTWHLNKPRVQSNVSLRDRMTGLIVIQEPPNHHTTVQLKVKQNVSSLPMIDRQEMMIQMI